MWSNYVNQSHVSGAGARGKIQANLRYLLRPEECQAAWSNGHIATNSENFLLEEKKIWKNLNSMEKRVNGRMQTRLIIALPNVFDKNGAKNIYGDIEKELNKYGSVQVLGVLHRGKDKKNYRAGVKNLHLHIAYNDRDKKTGKKIRQLNDKKLLDRIKLIVEENIKKTGVEIGRRAGDLMYKKHFGPSVWHQWRRTGVTQHIQFHNFLEAKVVQQQYRVANISRIKYQIMWDAGTWGAATTAMAARVSPAMAELKAEQKKVASASLSEKIIKERGEGEDLGGNGRPGR